MKNISIHEFEATVHVNTVHGDYLEFVLDRASDRRDVDYYEILAEFMSGLRQVCIFLARGDGGSIPLPDCKHGVLG